MSEDRIAMNSDVQVIQVVVTNLATRGGSTTQEPIRRIQQFWSIEGELLAEVDPFAEMHALCPNCGQGFRRQTGVWTDVTRGVYCSLPCTPEGRKYREVVGVTP